MSTLTSIARALAAERGRAEPVRTVRHLHLRERPLVFVPLTLAGEACAPLAAMAGTDPANPRLLVVTQPRNRDQRFAFAAELAEIFTTYIGNCAAEWELVPGGKDSEPRRRYTDAPQVLVPGPAAVGFTRLLGRSTRFRRADGPHPVRASVPLLGRWLSYLAERAEVPGSSMLVPMTAALAEHWATGQSPAEDLNLAALMGWIDPPPGLTGPRAAAEAENPLIWPPAGPATDPTFDNELLAPLMAACDRAWPGSGPGSGPGSDEAARRRARAALERALAAQIEPAWRLMWRAAGLLRSLPPGGSVARRWEADRDSFTSYVAYLAEGGAPQPRRDGAVAAARRLSWLERMTGEYAVQRAFDDPLVMAEHRMAGDAFAGRVVAAEPGRVDRTGKRATLRPRIVVRTSDPVPAETGVVFTSPARPGQKARVLSVDVHEDDLESAEILLELSGGMGRGLVAPDGSVPLTGESVCYAAFGGGFQPAPDFPDPAETPWTHGGPPPVYVPSDEDAQEVWS